MIERLALALEDEFHGYRTGDTILIAANQSKGSFRAAARAVLATIREPTPSMDEASLLACQAGKRPADLYRIMIDAALAEEC
jgi:hypothetical protein